MTINIDSMNKNKRLSRVLVLTLYFSDTSSRLVCGVIPHSPPFVTSVCVLIYPKFEFSDDSTLSAMPTNTIGMN